MNGYRRRLGGKRGRSSRRTDGRLRGIAPLIVDHGDKLQNHASGDHRVSGGGSSELGNHRTLGRGCGLTCVHRCQGRLSGPSRHSLLTLVYRPVGHGSGTSGEHPSRSLINLNLVWCRVRSTAWSALKEAPWIDPVSVEG